MGDFAPLLSSLSPFMESVDDWRREFGDYDSRSTFSKKENEALNELVLRLKGNYPFHHPAYIGQMLKPPHPVAWAAYLLASTINPNNHALDGGPPTSEMEKEVVQQLADMIGYSTFLGHLTSSGTIANLEALWVASKSNHGKKVFFSSEAHYTHQRMCEVLGLKYEVLPILPNGDIDIVRFSEIVEPKSILVLTLGTTGLGKIEPLDTLQDVIQEKELYVHVDAAYGGFFKIIEKELPSYSVWELMNTAESVVIDPHKHGLQPYGCGAVIFKHQEVGRFYKHDSPYTYFTSKELHLGEISLECSRAGASAAALWTTLKVLPLNQRGLGETLLKCRDAALLFYDALKESSRFHPIFKPELDIVVYTSDPHSATTCSELSQHSLQLFESGLKGPKDEQIFVSLYSIPSQKIIQIPEYQHLIVDTEITKVLRSAMMKPEHALYIPSIMDRLHKHG